MQLGDARRGKLADNLVGFGRALRRAGLPTDSSRIVLAEQAAMVVGLHNRTHLAAALEAVLVSREQDRAVFRELFDAYFQNPEIAEKLLAQMLPSAEGRAEPNQRRPRVNEALRPRQRQPEATAPQRLDDLRLDAAMTASDLHRLKQADFAGLSAQEYQLVERLARDIPLNLPRLTLRRHLPGRHGKLPHWPGVWHEAARHGGELFRLPTRQAQTAPHPLLVLIDISGSMERYARLLLAFLHAATRHYPRRDIFTFGTQLTDLTSAFRLADTDVMLARATQTIADYAGGTRLGDTLQGLRQHHARRLVGRRTLVLLISDGLDTGEPEPLERELAWLGRHSRKLLWLNPLLRYEGYQPLARGAAALHRQANGMLAIHNLEKLEDLAAGIAQLMRH